MPAVVLLTKRLQEVERQIANAKACIEDAERMKVNARTNREKLEDLEITRVALESKLRQYGLNQEQAFGIRKEIVEKLWPQGRTATAQLDKALQEARDAVKKIQAVNEMLRELTVQHEKLVGTTSRLDA